MSLDMGTTTQRTELLDRNVKDMIMLVVVCALGGLLLYQHYRLQKAVDLISQLSGQIPGAS